MPLPRVSQGEPFRPSASVLNRTASAVEQVEALSLSLDRTRAPGWRDRDTILAKNDGATDIPMFGIVSPTATLFVPSDNLLGFQNDRAIKIGVPAVGAVGLFGVAIEPIAAGRIGRVVFSGMTVCKVDVTDPNVREVAEIIGDATKLRTAAHGTARIVARETGTSGTKWALVQLGVGRDPGIRWKPIAASLVGGSSPPKYKYTLQRVVSAADGVVSIPSGSEQVYGFNDWDDQINPWHGQSATPGASAQISVVGPVVGPIRADFAGVFDAGDGTPIYRFDAQNPMGSDCASLLDAGPLSQAQAEDIAEGT